MSDVTICRTCGLPRFHGPAGYAGAQCLCQWKGATLPQMYDELMAKNAALEAECERLRLKVMVWNDGKPYAALKAERDALAAELAITRRVIDRIGQLCTTPHESKERFIRRVQSAIEWQTTAQQDQPK